MMGEDYSYAIMLAEDILKRCDRIIEIMHDSSRKLDRMEVELSKKLDELTESFDQTIAQVVSTTSSKEVT